MKTCKICEDIVSSETTDTICSSCTLLENSKRLLKTLADDICGCN